MTGHLFPFLDYWWFYAAFTGSVVVLLALDLGVGARSWISRSVGMDRGLDRIEFAVLPRPL